ncbi:hypothetical protein D5039_04940 [Verminephrobacter aporrectodeae subsp. tuberculatae]|uniref:Uncharacterized protein n=1 Tax=Verminephrobacter aporrectodeae subsp. tuberculatae TaxID=1110392 RepID=A0ABT3KQG6_9BURK|nr:hypothetical protein [Verminephrobacter aporrectodeae]MCW5320550.1 hypothetical protein [Verminephrobacter aporrectodeae subsp. tuberculatae]
MATLQESGRIALAIAIVSQPIHLAWGRGDTTWDSVPSPDPNNAITLAREIGRRAATQVSYCRPEPTGEIELATGRYALTATPTTNVYVKFTYAFGDAAGETVRELGIFLGTQIKATVPAGQRYFLPADLLTLGRLYALERVTGFLRSPTVRQVFEYVLPF